MVWDLVPPHLISVAVGGAAGAVIRYSVAHGFHTVTPDHVYRGTLIVNALGSLLAGCLIAWIDRRPGHLPLYVQHALQFGVLGALTTFSTFAVESLEMFHEGRARLALAYIGTSVAVSLVLAAAGYLAVARIFGPGQPGPTP